MPEEEDNEESEESEEEPENETDEAEADVPNDLFAKLSVKSTIDPKNPRHLLNPKEWGAMSGGPSLEQAFRQYYSIPHDASAVCDIMLLLGRSLAVKGQTHDSLIQQAIRRGLCRFEFWKARAAGKSTEAASALEASLLELVS